LLLVKRHVSIVTKVGSGYVLSDFLQKLIWSPCLSITKFTGNVKKKLLQVGHYEPLQSASILNEKETAFHGTTQILFLLFYFLVRAATTRQRANLENS
jgi:hypothetical protein